MKLKKKEAAAGLSVISNIFLIIIKTVVGILGGSVSILSEAIHSAMDLIASAITLFSVKISEQKPDEEHPYGHSKFENISGIIKAFFIFAAAIWIIYEAIGKIISHDKSTRLGLGFVVMLISSLVNLFLFRWLYKVAKATDSIALQAEALDHKIDVYTSLGVALGLVLIRLTGYYLLDPIIAILLALLIIRESILLLKNASSPLLDVKLPDDEIEIITNAIKRQEIGNIDFHQLRTRKAGNMKYVDLHLEVPQNYSVKESHDICDKIEKEIESKIKNIEVYIHVEPYSKDTNRIGVGE